MMYSTFSTPPLQHGIAQKHVTALETWLKVLYKSTTFILTSIDWAVGDNEKRVSETPIKEWKNRQTR